MSEQVLVFPAAKLEPHLGRFKSAIITDSDDIRTILTDTLADDATFYMDRAAAEIDPSFKQVIPYCVIWDGRFLLAYQRTKKGGEARLHDKWSIGVGGHINPCDEEGGYLAALSRELHEEIGLAIDNELPPIIALLYDPSNDVGKVHFGVVHVINVKPGQALAYQDEALGDGLWVTPEEVQAFSLENWSRLVIDQFPAAMANNHPFVGVV